MAWSGVEASGPRVVSREGKVKRAGSGGGGSVVWEGGLVMGRWRIVLVGGLRGEEKGAVREEEGEGWTVTGADGGVVKDFLEGVVWVGGVEEEDGAAGSGDRVEVVVRGELRMAGFWCLLVVMDSSGARTASLADEESLTRPSTSALFMCVVATNARSALRRSATWLAVPGPVVDAAAIVDLGPGSGSRESRAMAVQRWGGNWPIGMKGQRRYSLGRRWRYPVWRCWRG